MTSDPQQIPWSTLTGCSTESSSALQPHTARQEISKGSEPEPAFIHTTQRNTSPDLPVPIHAGMAKEMPSPLSQFGNQPQGLLSPSCSHTSSSLC